MRRKPESPRRVRLRKAAQRARARSLGLEQVSFAAPTEVMAKLRAVAPLHRKSTLQAVLVAALIAYSELVEKGTQDLASMAVKHWPTIRPLLPYLSRLTKPTDPPITVMGRVYAHADVAPLIPILNAMVNGVRQQGHTDYVHYLDILVGRKR